MDLTYVVYLILFFSECKDFYYRPQRSWAKVMFLQAPVILSTERGGCLPQCKQGYHSHPPTPWEQTPPGADTPPDQTPTRPDPPGAYAPNPREQRPPEPTTPPGAHPQPPGADTPPGKQTPAYGQWAAGTHPTGMHSCLIKWLRWIGQNHLCIN